MFSVVFMCMSVHGEVLMPERAPQEGLVRKDQVRKDWQGKKPLYPDQGWIGGHDRHDCPELVRG